MSSRHWLRPWHLLARLVLAALTLAVIVEVATLGARARGEAAGGQILFRIRDLGRGEAPAASARLVGAAASGAAPGPVSWRRVLWRGAGASLPVAGGVMALSLAFGPVLGVLAVRYRRAYGFGILGVGFAVLAWVPGHWLAGLAVWGQVEGWGKPGFADGPPAVPGSEGIEALWEAAQVACLAALAGIGWQFRAVSGILRANARLPHVQAARVRGLGFGAGFERHVLEVSPGPLIHALDRSLPAMLGMQILVEWVLRFPGLGRLLVESARAGDLTGVLGAGLIFSAVVVVVRWVAEGLRAARDPFSGSALQDRPGPP